MKLEDSFMNMKTAKDEDGENVFGKPERSEDENSNPSDEESEATRRLSRSRQKRNLNYWFETAFRWGADMGRMRLWVYWNELAVAKSQSISATVRFPPTHRPQQLLPYWKFRRDHLRPHRKSIPFPSKTCRNLKGESRVGFPWLNQQQCFAFFY